MDSTWLTLGILLAGVVVVVGGVLVLRLHAVLALILAALLVSALTPQAAVEKYEIGKRAVGVHSIDAERNLVVLKTDSQQGTHVGTVFPVLRPDETGELREVGRLRIERFEEFEARDGRTQQRAIARPAPLDGENRELSVGFLEPGDLIVHPVARTAAVREARKSIGERIAGGFGSTCGQIGILIAMASIIGKCLLDSGAADRIIRSAIRMLGERGAPAAFMGSGFLLGIPVFFDTVFYLMIPLGKAMRMRTGRNYLLYVLTIVCGGTMAHSLVPPTPGPLFVAEQLGVNIGLMILAGGIVGLFTSTFGYLYALVLNRFCELPLRESPEMSLADLEQLANRGDHQLPPLWLALTPILLPVLLIGGDTALELFAKSRPETFAALVSPVIEPALLLSITATVGNKNIALVLAAAVALVMLVYQKRIGREGLAKSVQAALAGGGVIILITASGGAFGQSLQQTGVSGLISELPQVSPLMIVVLAFLITTAVRTAQGSGTVAMITAVGILAGLAGSGELGCHPVYVALAIGCGSKPIAWMNDSGFWVITKMSGMTEAEGLKYVTPMTSLMGVVGLLVTMLGVVLFPMAGS